MLECPLQENFRKSELKHQLDNGALVFSEEVDELIEAEQGAGRMASNHLLAEENFQVTATTADNQKLPQGYAGHV